MTENGELRSESFAKIAERNCESLREFYRQLTRFPMVLLVLLGVISMYASCVSVWGGESLEGWLWNLAAAVSTFAGLFATPLLVALPLITGVTLFEFILDRTDYSKRWLEHPRSSNWEWWVALFPSVIVGIVIVLIPLIILIVFVPAELLHRMARLFPELR